MNQPEEKSWHFTPGRVLILCIWSFLLGSWITNLGLHLELGFPVPIMSVTLGIIVALGSIGLWLWFSRRPADPRVE